MNGDKYIKPFQWVERRKFRFSKKQSSLTLTSLILLKSASLLFPFSAVASEKMLCIALPEMLAGYCYPFSIPGDEAFKSICSMTGGITLSGATLNHGHGSCYWHENESPPHSHHYTNYHFYANTDIGITEENGRTCTLEGNPINFTTGNKFQTETDFKAKGDYALHFTRYYNSQSTQQHESTLGSHWRHNFDYSLTFIAPNGLTSVVANHPDGKARLWSSINGTIITRQKIVDHFRDHDGIDPPYVNFVPPHVGEGGEVDVPNTYASRAEPGAQLTQTIEGWELTKANGQVEKYNSAGQITLLTTNTGFSKQFFYNEDQQLNEVRDHFGNKLTFTYNTNGRIESLTLPDMSNIYYEYDGDHLTTVIYPDSTPIDGSDNPRKLYHYDDPNFAHALTGISNENGNRLVSWEYDGLGRAKLSEHVGGVNRHVFTYNGLGSNGLRSTTVTGPLGKQTTYHYKSINGRNVVTEVEGHPSQACEGANRSNGYDNNGFLISKTDWNGNITTYQRDGVGNEISRTEAAGTPEARTITTEWHPDFRQPVLISEPDKTTTYTYTTQGQILTQTLTDATTNESRTTTFTYTAQGLVETIDGPRTDVTDVTTYSYDAQGNLTTVTNALGHTSTVLSHDGAGRPLTMEDANGVASQLTYDARGRLASKTTAGATTQFDYDAVGNITRVTQPNGAYLDYGYDSANRLTNITDSLGNKISYTLDDAGNRIAEQHHDSAALLTRTQQRIFDELSRMIENLGAGGQRTSYSYDANGNPASVTDPLGRMTQNAYDALNRLVQSTDPLNGITEYTYDEQDNLTSVTDPRGLTTRYSYNAFGDLISQTSPDTGTTTYSYDAAGNIKTKQDARGVLITYHYDALNRLTLVDTPIDSTDIGYEYDSCTSGVGRLCEVTVAPNLSSYYQIVTSYSYDTLGNVTEHQGINYGYDEAGNIASITYPSGRIVNYERNSANQISRVTTTFQGQTQTLADSIHYLPFGPISGFSFGNGLQLSKTYDQDYQLTGQVVGQAQDLGFSFDTVGNIDTITNNVDLNRNQRFVYDELNRLTQADGLYGSLGYSYDAVGNRLALSEAGAAGVDYTYATVSNQVTSETGWDYNHDANGNRTAKLESGNTWVGMAYSYDVHNRLASVTDRFVSPWGFIDMKLLGTYSYNGLGQRVSKRADGKTTQFNNGLNGELLAEQNQDGSRKREYIYLNGQPLAVFDQGIPTGNYHFSGREAFGRNATLDVDMTTQHLRFVAVTENRVIECQPPALQWNINSDGEQFEFVCSDGGSGTLGGLLIRDINGAMQANVWHMAREPEFSFSYYVFEGEVAYAPDQEALLYVHNDHLGTPQSMTNQAGQVVWEASYAPFGEVTVHEDPDRDGVPVMMNQRFPGQYFDGETGLYYNYFRDYDPSTGRYITSDPVGLNGGLNTYLYVDANPVRWVDPRGLLKGPFGGVCGAAGTDQATWIPDVTPGSCQKHDNCYDKCAKRCAGYRCKEQCDFDLMTVGQNLLYGTATYYFGDEAYDAAKRRNGCSCNP